MFGNRGVVRRALRPLNADEQQKRANRSVVCTQLTTPLMRIIETPPARSASISLWSSVALLALSCIARGQFYAVTELGTLGGTNSMATALNNHEQVVGAAQTALGNYHAFMFGGGRMTDLGTLGGSNSWAYGVNDNGWVVGGAELSWTNMHAFLCTNGLMGGGMMDLGTLGGSNSAACMVNLYGEVAGWGALSNGCHHAMFITNCFSGGMMDLGTVGGTNSELYCINSNGVVVGCAMMANGFGAPIMSTNPMLGSGTMMTMGMGGMGALGGEDWFVNDLGNTVGQAWMSGGNYHAFMSISGGMMGGGMNIDLGTLGGTNSIAYCLNNGGMGVGMAQLSNGFPHAFMATTGMGGAVHMTDLNGLVPTNSGWVLMEARGVNAAGQIVGWGTCGGRTNAFLLTPVSAPVMVTTTPQPQIVAPGTPVTLTLQVSASEPLTYQWLHDGVPIAGATNPTLAVGAMGLGNAGRYTATARNAIGTVANCSATVALFSMALTNGSPELTIAAPTGSGFRIDYCDVLGGGANWQAMTNFTMMGPVTRVGATVGQGTHARFYRAVMLP